MKKGNLSFGINAVVSGQKASVINAEPQLVANSTTGKFTITSPVSKTMQLSVGDNVMFLNNISGIEEAIVNRVDDLVAYAQENNIDLDSVAGQQAIIAEFTQWYIAKGVALYTPKGEPKMAKERFSEEDKKKFIARKGEAIVEANREALLARLGVEDATMEELVASITTDDIQVPEYHVHSGSKTATTSSMTGVGLQLNFTDTSIWNQLKNDIDADKRNTVNRIFDVKLTEGQTVAYNNGKEVVNVIVYPIGFVKDEAPVNRSKKED